MYLEFVRMEKLCIRLAHAQEADIGHSAAD
jgi:hypothetical protein